MLYTLNLYSVVKGTTEVEMAGWHHWLDGRESEWTPGVGDGHGAWLAAIHGVAKSRTRQSNSTELNWTDVSYILIKLEEKKNFKRKPTMLQSYSNQTSMLLA